MGQGMEGKRKVSLPRRGKEEQREKCPRHWGVLSFCTPVGQHAYLQLLEEAHRGQGADEAAQKPFHEILM